MNQPHFEVYQDKASEYRFRLRAANGENVLATTEGYTTKANCIKGINSVKVNCAIDKRFKRKVNKNNEPYFLLVAGNGEELAKSETYSSVSAMEDGVTVIKNLAPSASIQDLVAV